MGKGGTKFVGDAVAVRTGKKRSTYTSKELKMMMDRYLETGQHPEVERLKRDLLDDVVLTPLPDIDPHRPYVFLDIKAGNKPPVRLVIELFEDYVPVACNQFRNRCLPGSSLSVVGTSFHRLLPGFALFGGKLSSTATGGIHTDSRLRHVDAGVVSVALTGQDFAITFSRAVALDRTHQVIGRVNIGVEHLEKLSDLGTLSDDSPAQKITITQAGPTTHRGTYDSIESAGDGKKKMTAAEVANAASQDARNQVVSALQEGMGQKRRAEGSTSDGRQVKTRMVDPLLADLSDESSSDGDDDKDRSD